MTRSFNSAVKLKLFIFIKIFIIDDVVFFRFSDGILRKLAFSIIHSAQEISKMTNVSLSGVLVLSLQIILFTLGGKLHIKILIDRKSKYFISLQIRAILDRYVLKYVMLICICV